MLVRQGNRFNDVKVFVSLHGQRIFAWHAKQKERAKIIIMKRAPFQNNFTKKSYFLLFVALTIFSCKKPNTEVILPDYQLVNLVSDVSRGGSVEIAHPLCTQALAAIGPATVTLPSQQRPFVLRR